MLQLSFKQTNSELMVRAAATVLFNALEREKVQQVCIAELAERPQYGFTASAAPEPIGPKFVRITDLQDGKIDWDSVPFCKCDVAEKYAIHEKDILFARTGATAGKTYLVRNPQPAVFASYLIRLRPKTNVEAAYLYSFFQSDNYWLQITQEKEGSAQPNVNGKKLTSLKIPLVQPDLQIAISDFLRCVRARKDGFNQELPELPPPLTEQRRIVAKIDELAAKIDNARELQERAAWESETLLSSEISHLFSKGREKGWTIGHLGDYVIDDCYGTSEKATDDISGTPILRMGNIQNGRLDLRGLKYLHLNAKDRTRLLLEKGDILVNRTNSAELVGKCAVFDAEGEYAFASYLIRLRLDKRRAEPRLVALYINSPTGRTYMFTERKQMTGQANVNATKLKALPIALPSLDEQRRIVTYLNNLESKVDGLKQLQAQTAAETGALLPSILDKAFKGEL